MTKSSVTGEQFEQPSSYFNKSLFVARDFCGLGFGCEMLRSAPSLGTDEAERTKFGRIVRITHQSPWVRVLELFRTEIAVNDSSELEGFFIPSREP